MLIAVVGWASNDWYSRSQQEISFVKALEVWDGADANGNGSTRAEVVRIVGSSGSPCESIDPSIAEVHVDVNCTQWTNSSDGEWMKAYFVNERLISVQIDIGLAPE